jgi:hypothetical protein
MLFPLGSVVPHATDAMCGPSIRVYTPLAPLRLPVGVLVTVNVVDASDVSIRFVNLDVIWSSLKDLSVNLAA